MIAFFLPSLLHCSYVPVLLWKASVRFANSFLHDSHQADVASGSR